ncbi:hypothetical protein BOX15_Mlig008590g2 [Macrostomum lignano]|uniref:BED-type domain-containing protein n=1 Tax=Macrostomum lignano TaxID=282301 RepID=A0A267G0R1_9PLAT|nr:hypothetical protein BOX15_Mlig008590g2 [Macrostomum lignano]
MKSRVWKYFEQSADKKNAMCKECNAHLKLQKDGSTKALLNHLRNQHKLLCSESESRSSTSAPAQVPTANDPEGSSTVREQSTVPVPLKQMRITGSFAPVAVSPTSQASSSKVKPSLSSALVSRLDEAAIKAIIQDGRSFGDFRKKGMQGFLQAILPGYMGPRRQKVTDRVDSLFEEKVAMLKVRLEAPTVVNFTTDLWTDRTNMAYMIITCHFANESFQVESTTLDFIHFTERHTAEAIAHAFVQCLQKYGLYDKFGKCTTDQGSNIVRAGKICDRMQRLSCLGHILHLVVCHGSGLWEATDSSADGVNGDSSTECNESEDEDDCTEWAEEFRTLPLSSEGTKKIASAITKIRRTAKLFRRSTRAADAFRRDAEADTLLPLDVKTRWSSTYSMLRVYLQRYPDVDRTLCQLIQDATSDAEIKQLRSVFLRQEEKEVAGTLLAILRQFADATEMLSGQNYPTANIAYIVLYGLRQFLSAEDVNDTDRFLRRRLLEQLNKYTFESTTFNILFYKTAAFLDNTIIASPHLNLGDMLDVQNHLKNEVAWSIEQETEGSAIQEATSNSGAGASSTDEDDCSSTVSAVNEGSKFLKFCQSSGITTRESNFNAIRSSARETPRRKKPGARQQISFRYTVAWRSRVLG